ncbi:MAG: serine/threonine protein kinase [Planctomycetes bacterium]|nr:serine/threonine protein kinase [Planctomycetota bacterium]
MGVVYLVHDPQLGVQRALKLLGPEAYGSPDAVQRFLREARTLARLRHPNLIGVVDADLAGASPYLVMPLVDGGDLAGLLRARGRLDVREALTIVDRIARAIDFAHAEGVLHRDLKPANVLLDRDGTPLVTDFGLARDLHSRDEMTKTGETMGTPRYMAPEQAAGETRDISPRSDVYSLGAILYELLAGKPPFADKSGYALIKAVLADAPTPLLRLRPDAPPDVAAVVACAMAKAPAERYSSAAALSADLRRALAGEPVSTRRAGAPERALRWARRHRGLSAAVGVAAVAVVAAGGLGWRAHQAARAAEAVRLERQARERLAAGDAAAAADLLARATARDPGAFTAWRLRARLALGDRDRATAALAAARAAALAPNDPEVRLLQGLTTDDPAAALPLLQAAVEDGAEEAGPALARAVEGALDRGGDVDLAALHAWLDRALLARPRAPGLHRARAALAARLGWPVAADDDLWEALRVDPDDPEVAAALVRRRLEALDLGALTRFWETAARRLGEPGDESWQLTLAGALEPLCALLGDAAAPPGRRVRAALVLAAIPQEPARRALAATAADPRAGPALAAACRGTLLLPAGEWGAPLPFDAWLEAAAARDHAGGALEAVTLLEVAPELDAAQVRALAQLARAAGPLLRAAAPLAAALAAAQPGAGLRAEAQVVVERLLPDAEPLVADAARAAAGALALLVDRAAAAPEEPGLALAFALAEELDDHAGRAAALAHSARAVDDLGPRASPRLLAARAAWRLERGEDDGGDAAAALRGDPTHLVAAAIEAQRPGGARRDLADPGARRRVAELVALAADLGGWLLPLPDGRARMVLDMRARPRAFRVDTTHAEVGERGLRTRGVTSLLSRFAAPEVTGVDVVSRREDPGIRSQSVCLQPAPGDKNGRVYAANNHTECRVFLDHAERSLGKAAASGFERTWVRLRRRQERFGYDDTLLIAERPQPRRLGGSPELRLEHGWHPGWHALERVVVSGVLRAGAARPLRAAAAPVALPAATPLRAFRGVHAPGGRRLVTLGELRGLTSLDRSLRLDGAGDWVGTMQLGARLGVAAAHGDLLVRARVAAAPRRYETSGLYLLSLRGDRVILAVASSSGHELGDVIGTSRCATLFTQRGTSWETPLRSVPLADGPVLLELERRGTHVIARCTGPDGAQTVVLDEPLDFPLDDPLEVGVMARGNTEAFFFDVEVLGAGPDPP